MNIKRIFAGLALGVVLVSTGCSKDGKRFAWQEDHPTPAYLSHSARMSRRADFQAMVAACGRTRGPMVDVHKIDRALTYSEIRSQYDAATANEFVAQGLDR